MSDDLDRPGNVRELENSVLRRRQAEDGRTVLVAITSQTCPRTCRRDFPPPVLRCHPMPAPGSQHLGA